MPRFSLKALYRWALSALAETAVAVPWTVVFYAVSGTEDWPAALPGAWLLLAAYGLAVLWEFGAPAGRRGEGNARLVTMFAGVGAVYLTAYYTMPAHLRAGASPLGLNVAMAVLPGAGYLWYQGAARAARGLEYGRIFAHFGVQCLSTVGAVIALLALGVASDSRVQLLLYWSLFLLFGAGLTLLVISRERALRADQARLGESGAGGEHMSPLLTGLVGGLMLLTLAASYLLSTQRLFAVLALLKAPFNWLLDVAMLIVLRWTMMIFWLMALIRRQLPTRELPEAPESAETVVPVEPPLPEPTDLQAEVVDWVPYLKIAVLVIGVIIAAVLVLRLRRRKSGEEGELDEERVSLGFWQALMTDLRSLWESTPAGALLEAEPPLSDDPRDPRALFRRLQQWGAGIGRPRGAAETPNRYGGALAERRPAAGEATGKVTAVYNQARYGANPPGAAEVAGAAAVLDTVMKGEK